MNRLKIKPRDGVGVIIAPISQANPHIVSNTPKAMKAWAIQRGHTLLGKRQK